MLVKLTLGWKTRQGQTLAYYKHKEFCKVGLRWQCYKTFGLVTNANKLECLPLSLSSLVLHLRVLANQAGGANIVAYLASWSVTKKNAWLDGHLVNIFAQNFSDVFLGRLWFFVNHFLGRFGRLFFAHVLGHFGRLFGTARLGIVVGVDCVVWNDGRSYKRLGLSWLKFKNEGTLKASTYLRRLSSYNY